MNKKELIASKKEKSPKVKDITPIPTPESPPGECDSICPTCGKLVPTHRCRLCGATRSVSTVSGNVVWMRNGRVVAAFQDARLAFVRMAQKHQLPENQWPVKFRLVK